MLRGSPKLGSFLAFVISSTAALSCSAPPVAKAPPASVPPAPATPAPTPPAPPVSAQPEAKAEPTESPGFSAALASLRPAGTEGALQVLADASNTDREAYAKAALAYAPTDVPGMTLLWGLSYQALGGGASNAAVATAIAKVLNERILAKPDENQQVTFNVRLAPGAMPVRQQPDGSVQAPLAHVFEALFSPAVTGFRPPWTIEQFYDVLSTWVGVIASHGTALDEQLELNGWLVRLAKAGHLEAFCFELLGPAFPAELRGYKTANAPALKAYRDFLEASALRTKRASMPDDLVRIK